MQSNAISWLFRISVAAALIGGVGTFAGSQTTKLAGMTLGEVSTLHAALFFATV
ncbi:hypothetical protein [Mesorhizobium ventifaucium]|nr:hypothetical protein [Mesorhizobium ventifaucium]